VNLGECLLRGIFSVDKLKSEKTEEEEEEEEENSETQSKDSTTTADSENKDAEVSDLSSYHLMNFTTATTQTELHVTFRHSYHHLRHQWCVVQ
jgi:hypothetical protein